MADTSATLPQATEPTQRSPVRRPRLQKILETDSETARAYKEQINEAVVAIRKARREQKRNAAYEATLRKRLEQARALAR